LAVQQTLRFEDATQQVFDEVYTDDATGRIVGVGVNRVWKAGSPGANQRDLQDKATQALAANQAFLAVGAPSNVQVVAQVKALTRECSALIRLLLSQLDDTAGT
jgi:hypothetical protein